MSDLNGFKFNAEINFNRGGADHHKVRPAELIIRVNYDGTTTKSKVTIKNIGNRNAYQAELFLFEDGQYEQSIAPALIGQEIDAIQPDEEVVISNVTLLFEKCGVMAFQQYWLEYADENGKLYRYVTQLDMSGVRRVAGPQVIKRRTSRPNKTVKNRTWLDKHIHYFRHPSRLMRYVKYMFRRSRWQKSQSRNTSA